MGTIREYRKADGSITYHAEVRLKGLSDQRASFRTKSLAKKWIQDTESAFRDGRHSKTVEAKKHTIGELIDKFIVQWLPKFPKSQSKQTSLLTWWKLRLGHLSLYDVTPSIISEYRDELLLEVTKRKKMRSPSTVNRYLAALSKAFSVAVQEWGWLNDSPIKNVSKPQEAPGRDRFLSLEEKERLLFACKNSPNPLLYPLVSLSILSAMRYSELINLKFEDISFESKTIVLRETKNGDKRVIPLTKEMETILKQCQTYSQEATGLIFRSNRQNKTKNSISVRRVFQNALKEAQIENFRWHDLRHTAASYLAMNGATQGELMVILGHRSPHMTRRYAHYSQEHIASLMQKVNSKVFSK